MFCFLRSCFLILENRSQTKIWIFIRTFLVLLFSVRIVVEYVKESQGGFESTLDYFQLVNGLIPFIIIGLYFIFTAEKTSKI
jgi:prolipoprotein diacylglyceryltransferase